MICFLLYIRFVITKVIFREIINFWKSVISFLKTKKWFHGISAETPFLLNKLISRNIFNICLIISKQVLESDYVVRLLDVFAQGLGFVLVFEFMISDLSEMIQNIDDPLKENQVKRYMQMLLHGVAYLHSQSIMHRDLKPANLLIRSVNNFT